MEIIRTDMKTRADFNKKTLWGNAWSRPSNEPKITCAQIDINFNKLCILTVALVTYLWAGDGILPLLNHAFQHLLQSKLSVKSS